jgi:hypothetical protein
MMNTHTIFNPVMIRNVCSKTYLDMFMHLIPSIELWEDEEQIAEEDYDKINLTKLNLIEHGHYKNPVLAGIAIGLMSQIYDAGGKDYFIPEIHFCGISVKDKTTKVNLHTDNWDEKKLKVLGILNSDWDNRQDGGGFIYEDMSYSLQPMNFLIFDSRQTHSNDIIFSDKERIAVDFTVTKL